MDVENKCRGFKYILGITSLWLLIPSYVGFRTLFYYNNIILSIICLIACIISTCMWYEDKHNSILYNMDLWFAKITYVSLIVNNFCNRSTQLFFPIIVILLYIISDKLHYYKLFNIQLWGHILFRYTGFWWMYLALVPTEYSFIKTFIVLSSIYFGHIIYSIRICSDIKFTSKNWYFVGCLEILFFILCYIIYIELYGIDIILKFNYSSVIE